MIGHVAGQLLSAAASSGAKPGGGEEFFFWVLGPIAFLAALGLVLSRSAVHAAVFLAVDMLCLAAFYAVQDAPFLAFVQVIVYTGAIMMLFLFVLMLVGVDSSDSLIEVIRGQRLVAAALGVGMVILLVAGIGSAVQGLHAVGLRNANSSGNVTGVANLIFSRYVFAFEATSALLITAALGAMVLAHRERIAGKLSQRDLMRRRFLRGAPNAAPLPGPGVFATGNAVDTPALLPDGTLARGSVDDSLEVSVVTSHVGEIESEIEQ